ncbi:MAG TPA: ArsA-related P-loop ATPase [Polyangiaceae bacterium]|nr:ArsA-related P-loop ATPase [Polyangiaceae bacterium]
MLSGLIEHHRVLICAGCGGVGKTTTAASLAIAAAARGRRVLALTVDPAERLTASLGLKGRRPNTPTPIALDLAALSGMAAGAEQPRLTTSAAAGSLHVMIHDPKMTFDELVLRHAGAGQAARILGNPMYQQLSTKLAGVSEYMAVEKLLALHESGQFDLIVLDTPPTRNALDFLTAPARLQEGLGSGAARWFVRAFAAPGQTSVGVLRRSVARALRGVGKLSSNAFLQDFAVLLAELDELFSGFSERSRRVAALLGSREVSYLVISSPEPLALREARFFLERLRSEHQSEGVLLINRVRAPIDGNVSVESLLAQLSQLNINWSEGAAERVARVLDEHAAWAQLDAARVREAAQLVPADRFVTAAALRGDIHDMDGLVEFAKILVSA